MGGHVSNAYFTTVTYGNFARILGKRSLTASNRVCVLAFGDNLPEHEVHMEKNRGMEKRGNSW